MKKTFITLTLAVMTLTAWAQADYDIIPRPLSVGQKAKGEFALTDGAIVSYPKDDADMKRNAEFLSAYIKELTDVSLTVAGQADAKGSKALTADGRKVKAAVTLKTTLKAGNKEAYQLTVDKNGVTIEGASPAGVFYGIQTLRKAIGCEAEGDTIILPYVTITDEPRFAYRGVHIDCARHFFSVDFIKKYIDIMALHGCNNLHWHITDDQGWRFEVKSMPELALEGSIRKQTVIGRNLDIYDGQEYGRGMYYTQEQCRDIVAYAAERYINVIPEIDLPGHMLAALHVYPELGCTGGPYDVCQIWGVSDDVLCAGNPKTLEFLKKVYDELTDVFPSKLIHIGGDESPRVRWKNCPKCQARMKELGLTHESQLQTYINKELEAFLQAKGRQIIGWDEVLEGGLSDETVVMSWRGYNGGIAAARQHHHVIMTPTDYCYIDYYQLRNTDFQPLGIGGYLPLSKVYSMEPVPQQLSEEEQQYIMGPQCNLWTEYIGAPEHMEYMLLPRLDAMSEVQWTARDRKDLDDFRHRLPRMLGLYDKLGYKYCPKTE